MVPHVKPSLHFMQHDSMLGDTRNRMVAATIWTTVIWEIWNVRNNRVFKGEEIKVYNMFASVKAKVWSWLVGKNKLSGQVSFREWSINPRSC